jgi:hypothetical protein
VAGTAVSVPLTEWQPTASGNAEIVLGAVPTAAGPALKMDFDFKGGKGFVVARRAVGQACRRSTRCTSGCAVTARSTTSSSS